MERYDPRGDLAVLDPLDRLAKRGELIACIDASHAARAPAAPRPALIQLDLARFKVTNDSLGPVVCDRLLRLVAQRLRSAVPDALIIARVSGDGFAVLVGDAATAPGLAIKLLDLLGRPFAVSGNAVTLGASIGIAVAGDNGETGHDLLHAADLAMHAAQTDGRNRVRSFDTSMRQRAQSRFVMETDLRSAIASQQIELQHALISQQFDVHYQPQVRLADGVLTGFEALLRWRHPERGIIRPDEFIAVAEDTGLIDLLGEWVLRTACREALGWHPAGDGPPIQVAVNVSPLQLRSGNSLVADIGRILAESGLPPARLEIELTETALADGIGDTLLAIRALGVELALDDFGTGFSSLNQLRNHPFSRIKIDRSFVLALGEDRSDPRHAGGEVMVRTIASMGRGLGLETIVEGVETPYQLGIVRDAGCTTVQGFLVSRAVPAGEIPALIERLHRQAPFAPAPA